MMDTKLNAYNEDNSPSKKKRERQKMMRSIDKRLQRRQTLMDNQFGLDFSLMSNPLYNPFASKNEDKSEEISDFKKIETKNGNFNNSSDFHF
jgi:hypothetical protein